VSVHRWPFTVGIFVALAATPALAQDFTQGKTPAQLFAGDCAACHKTPQGLAHGTDARSIAGFLREHYTTKPEMADALAAFVISAGAGNGRPQPATTDQSNPKPPRGSRAAALGNDDSGGPGGPGGPGDEGAKPPAKPRTAAVGDEQRPSRLHPPAPVGDAAKPSDEAPRPKPQAEAKRTPEENRKPAEPPPQVSTNRLSAYARAGASDKDRAGEGGDDRESKLQYYANAGEAAPAAAPVAAVPRPVAAIPDPPARTEPDAAKAADAPPPAEPASVATVVPDTAIQPDQKPDTDEAKPQSEEAPKPVKPRRSADASKPQDGKPRRNDSANAAPTSPMSFFGRIFTGGARPHDSDAPN
jgi:hypothetical protein